MLQLTDVDVYYGQIHALKSVSLRIEQGELVTLVGANGAGKSTTLKTISGILHPRNGRVTFFGEDIGTKSMEYIVRLGIAQCPEGRRVFPDLTVLENLRMGAYTRREKTEIKQDFDEVFSLFPILNERKHQSAGSLSGGEQQMLAIGRAMMSRPRLMMFDEPSLGLAPLLVDRMAEVISLLHERGTTILLVEQNAEMALSLADRVYVLETGKVVLEGPSQDVLHNEHVRSAYLGK
ncbi:MAG: ABC transporter ATP-binding protein [Anaerolineae bacterium UTCFX2]|jgi:branched-chain amino acid transport system ATP-binding protein|nr:ABC transporter ATP-binding protein [Anaerolineales bacterium]OQY90497.1 MAG: ABC transporter ATP-binding protein [Anaerolineae bacterium UTCFX2]